MQITGNIIHDGLVYPLVFPRLELKNILINPEAVKSQDLLGTQEPTLKISAARMPGEHLQLSNKKDNPIEK